MKRITFFLAIVLTLSSCGSLSVSKMRYNRGLNIDWFSSKDDKGPEKVKKEKTKPISTKPEVVDANVNFSENFDLPNIEDESEQEIASIDKVESAYESNVQNVSKKNVKPQNNTRRKLLEKTRLPLAKTINKLSANKFSEQIDLKDTKNANEDPIMLIVLIIVAIFIPPLALLLFEGASGNFWLNLLVCLIGLAIYAIISTHLGAIILLAAVIHALLVILGLI